MSCSLSRAVPQGGVVMRAVFLMINKWHSLCSFFVVVGIDFFYLMGADGRVYISEVDSVEVWGAKLGAKCDIQNPILGGTPITSRQRTDSTLFAYSDGAMSNQSIDSTLFAYGNQSMDSTLFAYSDDKKE